MKTNNRFYTYAYLREDGTPYYIGKGSGYRISRLDGRPCGVPKDKSRIIFLKKNLTEEEAFKHEKYMIAVFGRKDLGTGILYNKTNGGDGTSGWIVSDTTKRKIGESNKGKKHTEESKEKIRQKTKGKNNFWYGKSLSKEHKKKLSVVKKGKYAGENNPNYGKTGKNNCVYGTKWWNDGCGNYKRAVESPGENWVLGRKNFKNNY